MPIEPPDGRLRVNERLPGVSLWGSPWLDLELVRLNPDLGEYFGTREGILVVQGARDESLPLMGGDVILTIDDRQPTTPGHAMRILRSYAPGETVRIEILRKQKRQTLTWTVRERAARAYPGERRPPGGGVGT
jgi:S1-C subfamily serine protease